jgi:hypothetical protein
MEVLPMTKIKVKSIRFLVGFFLLLVGLSFIQSKSAYAATGPISVKSVDYSEENIIINNNGNSKIYLATEAEAAKGNWDVLNADVNGTDTTTIDFSWVSSTTENILKFKGEENSTQVRVILKERTRKLEIAISYAGIGQLKQNDPISTLLNIMTTEGTAEDPVTYDQLEWKKGDGGNWKDTSLLTVGQLEKYQIRGTYLYFRIKAVNDNADPVTNPNPDGTKGRRPSNAFKIKIAKKVSPMVVGIDGEKFTADIKYGKEYRVTVNRGTSLEESTDWIQVTDKAVKKLSLASILDDIATYKNADGTTAAKAFPSMFLEIRDYATSKAAASKITEIELNDQRVLTGSVILSNAPANVTAADNNVYITYNGNKNIGITVPSASTDNPYEYCVVKPNDTFNLDYLVWSSITKATEVKVLSSKAVDGGTLYIRQKEIKSKAATRYTPAVEYALASTYVSHFISYPSIPDINKTSLVFTKGYSNSLTFTIKLNEIGKKPFETQIKSIKLGTRDIGFNYSVSPTLPNPVDGTVSYSMTVTLLKDSLETMTNCYGKLITINFGNGTVDKTSVKLTVQSPTPASSLAMTVAKGTATGTTAVTTVSSVGAGNVLVYTIGPDVEKNKNTEDKMLTGTAFTSGGDIAITANQYLTIYEIDATTKNIVKYKSIQITADMIK